MIGERRRGSTRRHLEWLVTRDTGMGEEGDITTEEDVGMDRTMEGTTGVDMDAEDLGVVVLVEVASEVAREALVEDMPMVEVLEVAMDMVGVVDMVVVEDAGVGTMEEGLDKMAIRMVEDLVRVAEVEVAEEVVCRVDQGGVDTLLL